jgi:hypothetical protein
MNTYAAHFAPNDMDPTGEYVYAITEAGFGFGIDTKHAAISAHVGTIKIAGIGGGCSADYQVIDTSVKFKGIPIPGATPSDLLVNFSLGNYISAHASLGVAAGPKCPKELEGTSASMSISIGFVTAGGSTAKTSKVMVHGIITGGFHGMFHGRGKVMASKRRFSFSDMPVSGGAMVAYVKLQWRDCWDTCCEFDDYDTGGENPGGDSTGGGIGTPPVTPPSDPSPDGGGIGVFGDTSEPWRTLLVPIMWPTLAIPGTEWDY